MLTLPKTTTGRVVTLAAAVASLSGAVATPAPGSIETDRREQMRYARETMRMPAWQFVQREDDFRANGCWSFTNPGACRKPLPYNYFEWTDDGCSWTPGPAARVFNPACRQHDFGYRNFGKNLTLNRSENARAYIDGRFRTEMFRICNDPNQAGQLGGRRSCRLTAKSMWTVVRGFNDWRD